MLLDCKETNWVLGWTKHLIEPSSALTIDNRYVGSILLDCKETTDTLPTKKVLSPTDLFYAEIPQTTKQFVILRSKKTKNFSND